MQKKDFYFYSLLLTYLAFSCTNSYAGILANAVTKSDRIFYSELKLQKSSPDVNELNLAFIKSGKTGNFKRLVAIYEVGINISGFDINSTNSNGDSAFLLAVFFGHLDTVSSMLNYTRFEVLSLNIFASDDVSIKKTKVYITAASARNNKKEMTSLIVGYLEEKRQNKNILTAMSKISGKTLFTPTPTVLVYLSKRSGCTLSKMVDTIALRKENSTASMMLMK